MAEQRLNAMDQLTLSGASDGDDGEKASTKLGRGSCARVIVIGCWDAEESGASPGGF